MREGYPHTTKFLVSSYLTLAICALGIIGNLLCAVVQFNKRTKVFSYIYVVRSLTISDLLLLTLGFLRTLRNMGYFDLDDTLIFFWDWMAASSTKYLTVAISAERSFAINYPFKAMNIINSKLSKWYALGIVAFCMFITIMSFVFHEWIDSGEKYYDLWASMLLQIIPIVLVIIFNVFIFYGLQLHSRNNIQLNKNEADETTSVDRMLIGIVLTFAFCHSFELLRRTMNFGWGEYMTKYDYYEYDINILADIFYVLNSSLDFFIYFLFGKKFRAVFLEVFGGFFGIKGTMSEGGDTSSTATRSRNVSIDSSLNQVDK